MTDYSKKRILFIVQLPPPVHGASIMNNLVINSEIIKREFSIDVINLQFAKSIKGIGKFSLTKILKSAIYAIEIFKRINFFRPDLIYFTLSATGYAFYRDAFYVLLMKMLNIKIVFHLHGKGIKKKANESRLKKMLYKKVFNNTEVICLSKKLMTDIENVSNSIPYVVPNGIQVKQKSTKFDINKKDSFTQILFLSNYIRSKGVIDLMDALNIINIQGLKFKIKFVGAPYDITIEFLESLAQKYRLSEMVEVTGPLYGEQKIKEFQNADIFVFPTFYKNEAFPLVLLEAAQFCLPVISTYEGGIPDIVVDGESGFLVDSQNPELLAEKIAILLNNKDLGIEMGKNAYNRFMTNFTLEIFEKNMLKTFNSILNA